MPCCQRANTGRPRTSPPSRRVVLSQPLTRPWPHTPPFRWFTLVSMVMAVGPDLPPRVMHLYRQSSLLPRPLLPNASPPLALLCYPLHITFHFFPVHSSFPPSLPSPSLPSTLPSPRRWPQSATVELSQADAASAQAKAAAAELVDTINSLGFEAKLAQ